MFILLPLIWTALSLQNWKEKRFILYPHIPDLPKTTRKRSSSSPEQPPHCRIHKKHLELYIDYCAEWWVLIPLEQQVIRHQLLCTPYIPDTIERGSEIEVHFHMHADVPGTERVSVLRVLMQLHYD